jgi:hypothetical protein
MTIGKSPLYHFTDTRNIPSIKEHGLLSLAELKRRNIEIPAIGSNDVSHKLDAESRLDEYIHLCFFDEHPMEYTARQEGRIDQSRFLKIKPIVLEWEAVKLTLAVANERGTELLTLAQAKEKIDIEIICPPTRQDWNDPNIKERRKLAKKYEILIPNVIPIDFIIGV